MVFIGTLQMAREGYRLGHSVLKDHLFLDGLEDGMTQTLMGQYAEAASVDYGLSREAMDKFTYHSYEKAHHAVQSGWFESEVPLLVHQKKSQLLVTEDEVLAAIGPLK